MRGENGQGKVGKIMKRQNDGESRSIKPNRSNGELWERGKGLIADGKENLKLEI